MNEAVQSLVETQSVVDAINGLFVATDERDWPKVRECFASNVLFDMSSMSGEPATELAVDRIIEAWETGLGPLKAIHHQAGNYQVEVSGSEANARCYGIAYHYLPNPTGQNTRVFVGSYDFHLQKSEDRWRIDRFKFNLKFIDGNPTLEAE